MQSLYTLGPPGTFSEIASIKFIEQAKEQYELTFKPTIKSVFDSVTANKGMCVIPFENFSEGFIALVLDTLLELDLKIVAEVLIPVEFSFVSKTKDFKQIKDLYVQFVAKGQCLEFIENLEQPKIHLTESNIESLDKLISGSINSGAIVPKHVISNSNLHIQDNVHDYADNQTRFFVLTAKNEVEVDKKANKTSILVLDDDDHPGVLGEVLQSFSSRSINLTNIISRPTRKRFGKYHFFIEFNESTANPTIAEALEEIKSRHKVKVLGSYYSEKL